MARNTTLDPCVTTPFVCVRMEVSTVLHRLFSLLLFSYLSFYWYLLTNHDTFFTCPLLLSVIILPLKSLLSSVYSERLRTSYSSLTMSLVDLPYRIYSGPPSFLQVHKLLDSPRPFTSPLYSPFSLNPGTCLKPKM